MRKFLKIAGVMVALYIVLSGALLLAMHQPADTFSRIIARTPKRSTSSPCSRSSTAWPTPSALSR